eukprot:765121-Hanusia_phi.AAC.1
MEERSEHEQGQEQCLRTAQETLGAGAEGGWAGVERGRGGPGLFTQLKGSSGDSGYENLTFLAPGVHQ